MLSTHCNNKRRGKGELEFRYACLHKTIPKSLFIQINFFVYIDFQMNTYEVHKRLFDILDVYMIN